MNRQSITKAQKPNSQTFLPATDILQRKRINRTDFGASTVDIRSSSEQADKTSLPNIESHFNHDFSKIPGRLNFPYLTQAKLKIGQPGDKYEQEADLVAEQVMRMPEPRLSSSVGDSSLANSTIPRSGTIQRACASCSAEYITAKDEKRPVQPAKLCPKCRTREQGLIQTKQITPLIQAKTTGGVTSEVTPTISSGIKSLQGGGQPLSGSERGFFEPRFGADFSNVRVHNDARAANTARSVNARAFTQGHNVVFGAGEYSSDSLAGKKLLAHELTHVVQQSETQEVIQRRPNPDPPPGPFIAGRPAHNHSPLGNWSAVQANARLVCASQTRLKTIPLIPIPIPIPPTSIQGKSECACAVMSPLQVLNAAKLIQMSGKPLAIQHLEHYISAGGTVFIEDTNLDNLMINDSGAREVISRAISALDQDNVFIRQSDYSDQNFRLAFGGIDRVDYQVNRSAGEVDVWFKDRYDFHPAGFGHVNMGVGDSAPPGRPTNCVHLAAVEAKSLGASDYWMIGHATLPLRLFVSRTPSSSSGDDL